MGKWFYLQLILTVIVLGLGAAWMVLQWNECRDAGLSILYCIQHVS